jgi:hypothetical protein
MTASNYGEGGMNANRQAFAKQLDRHVAGIPSFHERNEKFFASKLPTGMLPGDQGRPCALNDNQENVRVFDAEIPE